MQQDRKRAARKWLNMLAACGLMAVSALAMAAAPVVAANAANPAPNAAQVKAAHDLMAAMQTEKMARSVGGGSKFPNEQQRQEFMAKLDKVPAEQVYTRLSAPVAKLLTPETVLEMTRFYQSSYGQKVLQMDYNSRPSMYGAMPKPTPEEKKALAKPAYVKADQEFQAARSAIRHEVFVLVTEVAKSK